MGLREPELRWSLPHRIAFRFIFIYLAFYLPTVFFNSIPAFELESDPYTKLCDPVVLWVGQHLFGVTITIRPAGSGDTTWNYVQVFCFAVMAAVLTVVWSPLDRRRPHYRGLHAWLRVAIRFALAMTMIIYGAVKVIKSQFPDPSLDRLLQTYGNSSPMGLLWTFMGYSDGYNFFAGAGELLGGILLATRRTTLLGALVSLGVVAHVAVLNLCYDVPVKLLSLHLVGLTLLLIIPDGNRLAAFFVLNRAAPPADHPRLFGSRWVNVVGAILGPLLLSTFLGFSLWDARNMQVKFGRTEQSALYGIWTVEEFWTDGANRPPLISDASRWRRVIFDNPKSISVQFMDDSRSMFMFELHEAQRTFDLGMGRPDQRQQFTFRYEQPEPDVLTIDGAFAGRSIRATLRRTKSEFFLSSRGFHWINEYPLNR